MTADQEDDDFIFREIADYTYDLESWIAPDGQTRWINPAVERITGYTIDECLARDDYPYFFVHPQDRSRVAVALEHAQEHISGNDLEFRIVRKDGAIQWGAISWQDLKDRHGRYRGYRTSIRDITSRKSGESEILASRDEAHRASQAKSEFLATMSHEIRTPIQNVLGYAQLLQRTLLSTNQSKYLNILAEQGEVLLRIVDDILDFTALQSVSIRMEQLPFDLKACITSVVDSVQPSAAQKGLQLDVNFSTPNQTTLCGDPHRLKQIITNLVTNAIKFTERGTVRIRVELTPVENEPAKEGLTIRVEDSGIGMHPEQLAQLFQPFSQGDASISRRYGGSGLGLNICKRLVDLMDGTISVDSHHGQGSTFTVRIVLPRVSADALVTNAAGHIDDSDIPVLDVLVVDDTTVARQMTVELLAAARQVSHSVGNGNDAIAALRAFPFDLVLMDKRMPELDGLRLTRMIRRDESIRQPYIVAVTANVLPASRQACLESGMDAFLGKPVRIRDLEQVIKDAAAKRKTGGFNDRSFAAWFEPSVVNPLRQVHSSGTSILQRQLPTIDRELGNEELFFRECLNQEKFDNLRERAHAVRGSLLAIGANRAAQVAQALENGSENDASGLQESRVLALCQALARTRTLLAFSAV